MRILRAMLLGSMIPAPYLYFRSMLEGNLTTMVMVGVAMVAGCGAMAVDCLFIAGRERS